MTDKKNVRERGKIRLSRCFQNLKEGEKVAVVEERSLTGNFPRRLQGRTGIVEGKQGRSYMVKINDTNKEKRFLIEPVHLKKIKN